MSHEHRPHRRPPLDSRFKWVLIAFVLIAGYLLITEHRAHVIEYLPLGLVIACVFLHWFMHGGHGKHDSDGQHRGPSTGDRSKGDGQ
jgi:hypothetical protein